MPKTPRIIEPFSHIYSPGEDEYPGPDTPNLRAGDPYREWVPNDHTFVKGPDGIWHSFGITAPFTPIVHEGEYCGYHISGPKSISLKPEAWMEHPKVLPPSARPGEPVWFWAPFVVERGGVYHMFYGPGDMRLATSTDLFHWEPQGTVFSQEGVPRDPCIVEIGGRHCMVYVAENSLFARWSDDLRKWSDTAQEIYRSPREGACPESPFLVPYDDAWYMFWCLYDGAQGPYDHRVTVLRSDDPTDFHKAELVASLQAHAQEIIHEEATGKWYISSAEWPHRGVSLAEMVWE